jgi:hypothetical protein
MIRTQQRRRLEHLVTTSRAHVQAVAKRHDLRIVPAGPYLYCVRRVPLLGAPIIYRAQVGPMFGEVAR